MCPQAALPDLNTAWIMDKREFLNAMKTQSYTAIVAYLNSINAALPDEYSVKISDQKYNEIINQDIIYLCNYCTTEYDIEDDKGKKSKETRPTEHKKHDIQVKNQLVKSMLSVMTEHKTDKVWQCSQCQKWNRLSKTKTIQTKLAEPFFLQVIPSAPSRTGTLLDRTSYKIKMVRWAFQFYNEIAHSMSRFRLEYKPKQDDGTEMLIQEGGEELDY